MQRTGSRKLVIAQLFGGGNREDGVVGREAFGDRVEVNSGARLG